MTPRIRFPIRLPFLVVLSAWLCGLGGCSEPASVQAPVTGPLAAPSQKPSADDVIESEDTIESLRTPLARLSRDAMNLALPGEAGRAVFLPQVRVVDLARRPSPASETVADVGAAKREWPAAGPARTVAADELSLWSTFFETVDYFHYFNFYNVRGAFEEGRAVYATTSGVSALAQTRLGHMVNVKGRIAIRWRAQDDGSWRIESFETGSLRLIEISKPLFSDRLASALSDDDLGRVQNSNRDKGLVDWVLSMRRGEADFDASVPDIIAAHRSGEMPIDSGQVSVVDLDRDGYDDFYLTSSSDTGLFFRNRGDGTFEEIGERLGLDLDGVHASVFGDFDNDGDADAFVSYLVKGSSYLRNEDGRFVERNELVEGAMPTWAVALSMVDYDNDGLLDVYFGAWAGQFVGMVAEAHEEAIAEGRDIDPSFPGLGEREAAELTRRLLDPAADPILTRPGPPNVLLRNVGGGRFARPAAAESVAVYFNTLATTWADYDGDGDMDLYVTNEAGPNQLFRNDEGRDFTDVSDRVTGEYGYGMGASWGDYDNDGRQDLYVTNMYSKAGLRIADQFRASDAIAASARGNSLIHNGADGFERITDTPVEAADFGWGSAFADFNNDGYLDLYAPAGYVTMPKSIATVGDT